MVATAWPADFDGLRVVQANSRPSTRPNEILVADCGCGCDMARVWVPARISGWQTQTDEEAWKALVGSYNAVMTLLGARGCERACMPALGASLYWPARTTATAAKESISSTKGLKESLELTFVVSKASDADIWVDEMRFLDVSLVQ